MYRTYNNPHDLATIVPFDVMAPPHLLSTRAVARLDRGRLRLLSGVEHERLSRDPGPFHYPGGAPHAEISQHPL